MGTKWSRRGISLVVDELRKGQRLVFRYPEAIPSFCINTPLGRATLKYHREYLSLTPSQFAKLFRPKHSLCNQTLELDIGDLKYISYPLICEDGISSLGTIDTEKYEPTEKVISLFNIVVCVVRDSALAKLKLKESQLQTATASSSLEHVGADPIITALGLQNSFREIAPETLERAVKDFSMALLFEERRQRYVSKQVKLVLELVDSDGKGGGDMTRSEDKMDDSGLEDVVSDSMANERHTSPTESNVNSNNSGSSNTGTVSDNNANSSKGSKRSAEGSSNLLSISCREEILQRSSLANEMRAIYHDLIGKVLVDVTINNNVHIKVPLQNVDDILRGKYLVLSPYQTLLPIADEDILRNILSTLEKRPMSTIPSSSAQNNQAQRWSSIDTKDLLFHANPTRTFSELCVQLELNLNEMTSLVQSICQSGLGKVISVITSSSIYQVHPHFSSSENAKEAANQFWSTYHSALSIHQSSNLPSSTISGENDTFESLQFAAGHTIMSELTVMSGFNYTTRGSMIDISNIDGNIEDKNDMKKLCLLDQVLKCFNGSDSVGEVIKHLPKGLDTFAIDIIVWLLRWNVLVEVEMYLIDTSSYSKLDDYEVCTDENIDEHIERGVQTGRSISTQHALIQDQALLDRLKPYLDGKTPMSEILYQLATQIDAGCRRLSFDNDHTVEGLTKCTSTGTVGGIYVGDDDSVASTNTSGTIPMFSVNADDVLALVARSNNRIITNVRPVGM